MVKQGGAAHGGGKLPAEDTAVVAAVPAAVALRPAGGGDLAVWRWYRCVDQRPADTTGPAVSTVTSCQPPAELLPLTSGS